MILGVLIYFNGLIDSIIINLKILIKYHLSTFLTPLFLFLIFVNVVTVFRDDLIIGNLILINQK